MSVSLVVIRVELSDQSPSPQGFQYSASELFYMSPLWWSREANINTREKYRHPEIIMCFYTTFILIYVTSCRDTLVQIGHSRILCVSISVEGMSGEELQEKALGVAKHTLSGKSDLERAAVLHQHIGRRAMGDMVIETFEPSPGESVHPLSNCNLKLIISILWPRVLAICPPPLSWFRKCLQFLSVLNTTFQL